jgi:hypothetical protein
MGGSGLTSRFPNVECEAVAPLALRHYDEFVLPSQPEVKIAPKLRLVTDNPVGAGGGR